MLDRHMAINNPHSIENFLTSGSRGYFSLWSAFWRYYIVGRIIAFAVAWVIATNFGFFGWFFGFLIWAPYWAWSLVTLWQCAPNSPWPQLAYVVRTLVYLEATLAIFNIDRLTPTAF